MTYVLPATLAPAWRAPPRLPWRKLRRSVWAFAGLALMTVGALAVVVPGHIWIVMVGLGLLLRNSMRAKRLFVRLQRKKPNWVYPLRRLLRPRPEVAPVLWQGILRTERLLLARAGRWRVLKRMRLALRRRLRAAPLAWRPSDRPALQRRTVSAGWSRSAA